MHLLFVCTANRCRSPAAAVMTLRRLEVLGRFRGQVGSAGLLESGLPMPQVGVALMARRGYDLGAHRSRAVDDAMLGSADLIVGMARTHARTLVARSPDSFTRTFGFGELVRRAEALDAAAAGEPAPGLGPWLARLGEGRRRHDLLGTDSLDVADPFDRPERTWETVLSTIDDLSRRLAQQLVMPLGMDFVPSEASREHSRHAPEFPRRGRATP